MKRERTDDVAGSWEAVRDVLGRRNHGDLLKEIVSEVETLTQTIDSRLDLKILRSSMAELVEAFRLFTPYRKVRKAAVFGSARTRPDDPLYRLAEETGRLLVRDRMMVITGAGGGIMEAANKGAGAAGGFGLSIQLPFEPGTNPYLRSEDRVADFKYFFTRKLVFMKESDAFVLFPGGFGTHDECFELLTLLQTGKGALRPVVLIDLPGGDYWETWLELVRRQLAERGFIDQADLEILTLAHSAEAAVRAIRSFYRNYHSMRAVGDRLMMRLQRPLSDEEMASLAEEFSDVIAPGSLTRRSVLDEERSDPNLAHLHPIWFRFGRRRYARLLQMIARINRL